jgi:hypothetical protein
VQGSQPEEAACSWAYPFPELYKCFLPIQEYAAVRKLSINTATNNQIQLHETVQLRNDTIIAKT